MGEYLPFWIVAILFGSSAVVSLVVCVRRRLWNSRYGSIQPHLLWERQIKAVYSRMTKWPFAKKIVEEIGICLSLFNAKRYQENNYFASLLLLAACGILLAVFVVSVFLLWPLWYYAVFFCLLAAGGLLLFFLEFASAATSVFLKHMPETVKILSARYTSYGSIGKALGGSLPDFHKSIRPEMIRIYDVIKQNDMNQIRETFSVIEEKYRNEHMTLMLELIWYAHYRGGDQMVRAQFEEMAKDVIEDLENKRDLRAAVMGYAVMILLFFFVLPLAKLFNESVLGTSGVAYYQKTGGMLLGVVYVVFSLLLLFLLLYLERTE